MILNARGESSKLPGIDRDHAPGPRWSKTARAGAARAVRGRGQGPRNPQGRRLVIAPVSLDCGQEKLQTFSGSTTTDKNWGKEPAMRRPASITDLPDMLALFRSRGRFLPQTHRPLNIFEPRFVEMVDDALAGNRLIGLIQPRDTDEEAPRARCRSPCGLHRAAGPFRGAGRKPLSDHPRGCAVSRRSRRPWPPYRQARISTQKYAADFTPDLGAETVDRAAGESLRDYADFAQIEVDWEEVERLPPAISSIWPPCSALMARAKSRRFWKLQPLTSAPRPSSRWPKWKWPAPGRHPAMSANNPRYRLDPKTLECWSARFPRRACRSRLTAPNSFRSLRATLSHQEGRAAARHRCGAQDRRGRSRTPATAPNP